MMRHDTPLRNQFDAWIARETARATGAETAAARPGAAVGERTQLGLEMLDYVIPGDEPTACELVGTFGPVESEYAALRRGAGVLDRPERAVIEVTGGERLDFLNRMITAECASMTPGAVRESFWLERKGRIVSDLLLVESAERMLIDVEASSVAATIASLDAFLFAEDVELRHASETWHRLSVHGPEALHVLADLGVDVTTLAHLTATDATIAGAACTLARRDQVGAPGIECFVPRDAAGAVWDALVDASAGHRGRPIGWFAFNTARIESGTPMFNIDFDTTSLPHESTLVSARVSFTKGCYLGQEIVARMENLGAPKQRLVGLEIASDALPAGGAPVLPDGAAITDEPIGVVTSSTMAPMLGMRPIAFAMVRTKQAADGAMVQVVGDGAAAPARVRDLTFWTPGAPS